MTEWIVAASLGALGAVTYVAGFVQLRRKHFIDGTPTSKVRSLALGRVEVHGLAQPGPDGPVPGPFSNRPTVFHVWEVERWRRGNKGGGRWVTVKSGRTTAPFHVRDDTGRVLVAPEGAKDELQDVVRIESRLGLDPPPHVLAFLAERHIAHEGLLGANHKMRFTERAILPGAEVYVLATAKDAPHVAEGSAEEGHHDLMLGDGHGPFLISSRPERELSRRLGWKAAGLVALGTLLAVAAAYVALAG